jgi:hypothetical protein
LLLVLMHSLCISSFKDILSLWSEEMLEARLAVLE